MLEANPKKRISAQSALKHNFFVSKAFNLSQPNISAKIFNFDLNYM